MLDVMIDLETLATENDAIVTSIGAVLMDMDRLEVTDQVFNINLDWTDQFNKGRRLHPATVRWWLGQSEAARMAMLEKPLFGEGQQGENGNLQALHALSSFVPPGVGVWGNGADFDCSIMQGLYQTYRMRAPWSFKNHRCFRTMRGLSTVPPPARTGEHHNALDDAVFQAHWLMEILRDANGGTGLLRSRKL